MLQHISRSVDFERILARQPVGGRQDGVGAAIPLEGFDARLPILIVGLTIALSIPLGFFLARVMDGHSTCSRWFARVERRLDTGPQDWKVYSLSLLLWTVVTFLVGFAVLQLQPYLPLNPDNKGMLSIAELPGARINHRFRIYEKTL